MRATTSAGLVLLLAAAPVALPPGLPSRADLAPDPTFVLPDSLLAQLTLVTDLALDPDGSLYLVDRNLQAVLHLERSGALRRIIGRQGGGPGEFSYIYQVGVTRDSLWAVDPGLRRITIFPTSGRGQLTVPFGSSRDDAASAVREPVRRGIPAVMLADGGFVVEDALGMESTGGVPTSIAVLRTDRDFVLRDTVTVLPFEHSPLRFVYRNGESHFMQPFSDDPTIGYASDGSLIVRVNRTAARGAAESHFTVTAWRGNGDPLWQREVAYRPARITRAMVDSVAELLGGIQDPRMPARPVTPDSIRARLYRPPMLPPVEQVVVGRDQSVWLKVRFADSPAGRAEWLLLSPRGFPLQRVSTDAGFRLLEAERAMLWGVEGDADDIPRVVRYRVSLNS